MFDLTAILLCGGKGERLAPFTNRLPKPLVPLNGKPLLLHLLQYLAANGVRRFVVCVGHKAEIIEGFLREVGAAEWNIQCVNSGDATMTDRLLDARSYVRGRALVCYGDTLSNVDLAALEKQHVAAGATVTQTVHPLRSPFGIVHFDGDQRITGFAEKPRLPHWINIGYMLCEAAAFEYMRPGGDMPEFLQSLVQARVLCAYRHEGKHLTINTDKDRKQAEQDIVEFYTVVGEHRS